MHPAVITYMNDVKREFPQFFKDVDILDVWSRDINGSNRQFFEWECTYVGIDLHEGKNVDIISRFKDYDFGKQFDIVISSSMLEHDSDRAADIQKMYDLVSPRGILVVTAAWVNFWEHGTTARLPHTSPWTNDFYRALTKEDVLSILPDAVVSERNNRKDLCFYVLKNA